MAVTISTSRTNGGGGAVSIVAQGDLSGNAVDIEVNFTLFHNYELTLEGIESDVDIAVVAMRVNTGGTYKTTGSYHRASQNRDEVNNETSIGSAGGTQMILCGGGTTNLGNAPGENARATIKFGRGNSGKFHLFNCYASFHENDTAEVTHQFFSADWRGDTDELQGIRIFLQNIAHSFRAGRFTLRAWGAAA